MKANRNHKDSMFSCLFSEPQVLRELYSALEGVELPQNVPIEVNTLENVLFLDKINDISFTIGSKLVVLIEHQSTIAPNIALRCLHYASMLYEVMCDNDALYSEKFLRIPTPEFFVLYNGTDPYPDEQILRLSDSFEETASLGIPEKTKPSLELIVRVLNINEGRNEAIVQRCAELAGYSTFVAKIREYLPVYGNLKDAIKAAIRYCKKHGILVSFLRKYGKEVLGMRITEWNTADAIAVARKEGIETGIERGRHETVLATARKLKKRGMTADEISEITGLDAKTVRELQT